MIFIFTFTVLGGLLIFFALNPHTSRWTLWVEYWLGLFQTFYILFEVILAGLSIVWLVPFVIWGLVTIKSSYLLRELEEAAND